MSPKASFVINEKAGDVSSEPDKYTRKDPAILTSRPDHIRRHDISDEELDMLCESRSDHVWEILLLAIGGGVAAFPSALAAMISLGSRLQDLAETDEVSGPPVQMAVVDAVQVVVFWSCLMVALCLLIVNNSRRKRSTDLRDTIRNRNNHE